MVLSMSGSLTSAMTGFSFSIVICHFGMRLVGFEPAAFCSGGRRSIH